MLAAETQTSAYAQTLHHINALVKNRLVDSAKYYNTIFCAWILLILVESIACIASSASAFVFGICASLTIITLLIAYIAWRFIIEKREEECTSILNIFVHECTTTFSAFETTSATYLIQSEAARTLTRDLAHIDSTLISVHNPSLKPAFCKLSRHLHGSTLFSMRKLLLTHAAQMLINVIMEDPTTSSHHKKLAIVYLEMARLYVQSASVDGNDAVHYRQAVSRAVSALQVAVEFDCQDPWIFEQLIECYGALKERDKQLAICAQLVKLRPHHPDILQMVGKRYFEHGLHAEGLKIYETLKVNHPDRARTLLHTYCAAFTYQ